MCAKIFLLPTELELEGKLTKRQATSSLDFKDVIRKKLDVN